MLSKKHNIARREFPEERPTKKAKVTRFDSDEEENEGDVSDHQDQEYDHHDHSTDDVVDDNESKDEETSEKEKEASGITWDDFAGYSAKEIFDYYQYDKLEQFYQEQFNIYPWMVQTREQTKPEQLAHHLCNCKKKYALLLKKGKRVTRKISEEKLKEFCDSKNLPHDDFEKAQLSAIDYCLRMDDQFCEQLQNLVE